MKNLYGITPGAISRAIRSCVSKMLSVPASINCVNGRFKKIGVMKIVQASIALEYGK